MYCSRMKNERVNGLSFVEWYESVHEDKWHEDYALMSGLASQLINEYQSYCKANNVKPIWNG